MGRLQHIARTGAAFIHALLPQDCALCAAPSGPQLLCEPCNKDLPRNEAACPQCANPSPDSQVCGSCLSQQPHYDATVALWRYEFPLDRLVLALKYGERLAFAAHFGQRMAAAVAKRKIDLIVPMPLHPDRLRQRGFNQAVEIARSAARQLCIPQRKDALIRTRDTASQAELPLAERARNVRNAFVCLSDLKDLSIAVVDDVMTSGATLNEAAHALKRAGARHVENWVVARAVLKDD